VGPFRSELTKLIRAVEEVPVPQKWARMPSWWWWWWWWWWVFPLSLLNIIIWYNKWGWRPYAADPWDQLAQSCKPCLYLPFGTATLGSRTLRLAGGVRLAHLKSKDAAAAPKHHGSEGRIGPAAGSPPNVTFWTPRNELQTLPLAAVRHCHPRSKDAAAAPKHHGSEGRIGPAAGSPPNVTFWTPRN